MASRVCSWEMSSRSRAMARDWSGAVKGGRKIKRLKEFVNGSTWGQCIRNLGESISGGCLFREAIRSGHTAVYIAPLSVVKEKVF